MLLENELLLYRLKPPITNLSITRVRAFNDVGFTINGRFAGRLHVTLEETPLLLLQLVETRKEIGAIADGEVTWYLDPIAHDLDVVVDSHGNLHQVSEL